MCNCQRDGKAKKLLDRIIACVACPMKTLAGTADRARGSSMEQCAQVECAGSDSDRRVPAELGFLGPHGPPDSPPALVRACGEGECVIALES